MGAWWQSAEGSARIIANVRQLHLRIDWLVRYFWFGIAGGLLAAAR